MIIYGNYKRRERIGNDRRESADLDVASLVKIISSVQQLEQNPLDFLRASRNTSRTMRGPSPWYFYTNSDPTTRMNEAVVMRDGFDGHGLLVPATTDVAGLSYVN